MVNSSDATERSNRFINKQFTDVLSKNGLTLKLHDMRTSSQG